MRRNLFVAVAILVIALAFTEAKAVENKQELALGLNGSRTLNPKVDLMFHLNINNLMVSYPYGYLGANLKLNKNFNAEILLGYGFEKETAKQGFVYGIAPLVKLGKFNWESDYEYWQGLNCHFFYTDLTYPLWIGRIGIDNRNYFYQKQDQIYQVGPSFRIPFSEHASLALIYFYSFEQGGRDANLFRVKLSLKF
ncbi:MAG: hypothetical protein NTX00_01565 [Candidatus Parcubacteria bacterium]|nr:hypothetical protein [Candidatus Parcubacteria bacterium]